MTRRKKTIEQLQDEYYEDSGKPFPPLTPQQLTFIEQLLTGKNISRAALASGVSRRSAVRWMEPGHPVTIEYERRRIALEDASTAQLLKIYQLSWDAIEALLTGADQHLRLAAAKMIYEGSRVQGIRPAGVPWEVEDLQDEEVKARKAHLFDPRTNEREIWLSDNPMEYFKKDEDEDEEDEQE